MLAKNVRNLYELWQEYIFGLHGSKPAGEFTAQERGRVKSEYSRRKVIWDEIESFIRAGYDATIGIDKSYEAQSYIPGIPGM